MNRWTIGTGVMAGLAVAAGCATDLETAAQRDFGASAHRIERPGDEAPPELDGRFESYLAYAMRQSPELEAAFERWRAAVLRIDPERRLPEPTITYAYFIRSVETRVGPQRHRLGLRQAFPWPTRLTAGADAAALAARAAEARFEAEATVLQERVARAFWQLWWVHRTHRLYLEQEEILQALVESVRARVETGAANLGDLAQVQLRLERLRDHRGAHHEHMRRLSAELVAAIGAPPGTPTPVKDEPSEGLPAEDEESLLADALAHPRVRAHAKMAEAERARARAANARRYPGLALSVDWTETGPARTTNVPDSGKDAVMAAVSVSVPLWGGSYRDEAAAARAESAAQSAEGEAARRQAAAALEAALSGVRDAQRRIELYRHELIPQAETVYSSVSGGLAVGRATLPQVMMAERDLLELQVDLASARSDHARAWARLERIVARDVARASDADATPRGTP
ncbi:MAG: TolC family protein [Myxococcota bacterium]